MLVLALTVPLFAQEQSTSAIWRGLVKNIVGTPMVGAKVRLKGTSTAESTTAADGSFSLAASPAGKYKLTIVADGTTSAHQAGAHLTARFLAGSFGGEPNDLTQFNSPEKRVWIPGRIPTYSLSVKS
jgi:hypothetical protein